MTELPRNSSELTDWYSHLFTPPEGAEALTHEQEANALEVVRVAMAGIEQLIEPGRIGNVELSFDIDPGPKAVGFNFSSPS